MEYPDSSTHPPLVDDLPPQEQQPLEQEVTQSQGFFSYIESGFKILGFNKKEVHVVKNESSSFRYAIYLVLLYAVITAIFVFAGIHSGLGPTSLFNPIPIVFALLAGIAVFMFTFFRIGINHLFAHLFGGVGSIKQYYAVFVSFAFALSVVTSPLLIFQFFESVAMALLNLFFNILITIYMLSLDVIVVREIYGLTTGKAVAVVLIPFFIILGVLFVLAFVVLGLFLGVLSSAGI